MEISKISEIDLLEIEKWKYKEEYSKFNYATKQWFESCCKHNQYCYKVIQNNKLLGVFLFQLKNEFRILINPEFIHKGFGKKITKEALNIGFNILDFNTIYLIVRKEHDIAINLYLSLGFNIIGETKQIVEDKEILFLKMEIERKSWK